jgi:tRNA (cytidine/uridine-2'-O-)-methyltransferase
MNKVPRQRAQLPFRRPDPPFRIVLVEPEIPPNTGNIARLCAATGSPLHLIEPLGFRLTDAAMKRAGLDYWEHVELHRHPNWRAFLESEQPARLFLFSTTGTRAHFDVEFQAGDYLVFGNETKGLPDDLLAQWRDQVIGIPQLTDRVRSLNLANTVGIALYEALRQVRQAAQDTDGSAPFKTE